MRRAYFIGLDIAKNVFQIFLADRQGREIANKKMKRSAMIEFFAKLESCLIGIEACGTAHHWARTLGAMGHDVKLIQPIRVKAFLGHSNKTDAADAKAICEALMHHGTRFVASKTIAQQDTDHLLSRRERLVANRTQLVNQTRSFLAERGIVLGQGRSRFEKAVHEICRAHWEEFSGDFQAVITGNFAEYQALTTEIEKLDKLIQSRTKRSEECRRLMSITGIGPLTALSLVSQVGDGGQFKNGRQLSAYLGMTPREHSSGGKQRRLGISKRGDKRLRTLLITAARAAMTGLERRKRGEDGQPLRLSNYERWILGIKTRIGTFKAAVAVANKMARIAWAVLAKRQAFNPAMAIAVARNV